MNSDLIYYVSATFPVHPAVDIPTPLADDFFTSIPEAMRAIADHKDSPVIDWWLYIARVGGNLVPANGHEFLCIAPTDDTYIPLAGGFTSFGAASDWLPFVRAWQAKNDPDYADPSRVVFPQSDEAVEMNTDTVLIVPVELVVIPRLLVSSL